MAGIGNQTVVLTRGPHLRSAFAGMTLDASEIGISSEATEPANAVRALGVRGRGICAWGAHVVGQDGLGHASVFRDVGR